MKDKDKEIKMLKHKETKVHTPNNGHFATKADLKDTEYHINTEILATKYDLRETKNELINNIQQIRTDLKVEFQQLKSELRKEISDVKTDTAVINERTKITFNILLVVLGAVLAPLVISLFPALSKLLA
jgi:vacuolar-type H+-ATPase subunit I/STV1